MFTSWVDFPAVQVTWLHVDLEQATMWQVSAATSTVSTVYIDSEIFYPGLLELLYSNKATPCIVQEASVMGTEESGSWQSWGRVDASLTLVYFLVKLSYIFWRWENETWDVNKDLFSNYPSPYLEFHKSQCDNYYDQLSLSAMCSSYNLDPEPLLWQETHLQ